MGLGLRVKVTNTLVVEGHTYTWYNNGYIPLIVIVIVSPDTSHDSYMKDDKSIWI